MQPTLSSPEYTCNMTGRASDLLQLALALSDEERAELASSLLESLDPIKEQGVQATWNEEIATRIAELDSGKAETIPWPEVQRRISAKLQNRK